MKVLSLALACVLGVLGIVNTLTDHDARAASDYSLATFLVVVVADRQPR